MNPLYFGLSKIGANSFTSSMMILNQLEMEPITPALLKQKQYIMVNQHDFELQLYVPFRL